MFSLILRKDHVITSLMRPIILAHQAYMQMPHLRGSACMGLLKTYVCKCNICRITSHDKHTYMYTVVPLLKDSLQRGHPSRKDTNVWRQVLGMHGMLPLTKGHLSNKDRISWQKGCPYQRGATVHELGHSSQVDWTVQLQQSLPSYP